MTRRPRRLLAPAILAIAAGAAPIDGPACCPPGGGANFVPPPSAIPQPVGPMAPMPKVAVVLSGWKGIAEATTPRRMAPNFFRLRASVGWLAGAPADPSRYRVAIDPPAGRAGKSYPLAPGDQPGASGLTVWVPVDAVADLPASEVVLSARVIDANTGQTVSDGPLTARIDQFPNPGELVPTAPLMFGWGTPLKPVRGGGQILARRPFVRGETDLNEGPQGLQFARIFKEGDHPGFFVSTTEATLDQVSALIKEKGYNPDLRPGEFTFSGDSPAIGVSPAQAEAYLAAIGTLDGFGFTYRLPTRDEWLRAAKAGKPTRFWWGDDPDDDASKVGANFKGLERPRPGSTREDEADVVRPTGTGGISLGKFEPNPWGLWHTFGNVAEWATDPSGGPPWLMGGTFRTDRDKANFRPEDLEVRMRAADAYDAETNPFAGIRPVVEISPEQGSAAARELLAGSDAFKDVAVVFDPESATATLSGTVENAFDHEQAGNLLRPLWFLAAIRDRLSVRKPPLTFDRVASLGEQGDSKGVTLSYVIDDRVYRVPVSVSWAEKLPVEGSTLWLGVYRPEGSLISASRVNPVEIGRSSVLKVEIDGAKMRASGLAVDAPVGIALSLGKSAAISTNDPGMVSEVVPLRWRLDPGRSVATGSRGRLRPPR